MKRLIFPIVLILMSPEVIRADQRPTDFASGFTVERSEAAPIWEVSLPEEVYRTVTSPTLEDLRVFSRDGRIVPHVIRRPMALRIERPAPRPLPFFPLRSRVDEPESDRTLHIVTNKRGEIVGATTLEPSSTTRERVVAYLIDIRGLDEMPEKLELEWKGQTATGFAVTVDLQASDDLSGWRKVVDRITLADLRSTNAALLRREVDLPALKANYLRIGWPSSLQDVQLSAVRAIFPPAQQLPSRLTIRATGVRSGDAQNVYEFDSNGFRPIDRARLEFQDQKNVVIEAVLLSRTGLDDGWRRRGSAIFYDLDSHGAQIVGAPAAFPSVSDRFWRAEISGLQSAPASAPTLELGWVPDLLTVMAQGQGPYTVAFGSSGVAKPNHSSEALLTVIEDRQKRGDIVTGRRSEVFTLGGPSRREPPFPWKTSILWSVLMGGVGLLAWMVRKLMKD
jgi:Protein of unknown function (DUF3999)